MTGQVHLTVDDTVATVELDNPGCRNAVSSSIFDELQNVLSIVSSSPEVRAVILVGRGADFSVGADLAAPPESRTLRCDSVAGDTARLRQASRTLQDFYQMPQVTIAVIDGACAGAGLSLAAAADFRIASDRAVFNTAFVDAGLSGDLGGIWLITHMLGAARARELFLAPHKLSGGAAHRLGLVNTVTPAAALDEEARALAHRVASLPPLAMRAAKQNLLQSSSTPLSDYLPVEVDRMVQCARSDDAREAAAAFLEKRDPVYTGC